MKRISLWVLGFLLVFLVVSAQSQDPGPKFMGTLHVTSDFAGGGPTVVAENANPNGDIAIDFHSAGSFFGNVGVIRETAPNRFFVLQNNPSGLPLTLAENGGNVGIGMPDPQFTLDVNGAINTSDCYREAGVQVAGTCASDGRLKKNIRSLSNSLDRISALQPVRFEWRTEEFPNLDLYSGTETGLVGQSVEGVFPHLVTTDAKGFKRVRYGLELQMHMIQAIKELKTANDELSTRIRQLEAKMNSDP